MNNLLLPLLFSMVIESAQPSKSSRVQSLVQKELCPHPKILQESFLIYFFNQLMTLFSYFKESNSKLTFVVLQKMWPDTLQHVLIDVCTHIQTFMYMFIQVCMYIHKLVLCSQEGGILCLALTAQTWLLYDRVLSEYWITFSDVSTGRLVY